MNKFVRTKSQTGS